MNKRRVIAYLACSLAILVGCIGPSKFGQRRKVVAAMPTFQGGYAAMDEVPVAGGELRLVVPQVIEVPVGDSGDDGDGGDGSSWSRAPGDDGVVDVARGFARQEVIAFPLRHTSITAKVAGLVGLYEIEQAFDNPFTSPIEAVYVFPLGDDAAVSGYQITIGDRTIVGEIHTREDARRTYEMARQAGHTAALLEQHKPNIFTQHVANIAPGETVKVKLTYSELLDYQDGTYELAVPLVVGPRYLPADRPGSSPVSSRGAGDPGAPGQTSIPYVDATPAGRGASTVSFVADIDAGVPIGELKSPSHSLIIERPSPTRRRVTLERADELPNRDLVVHYATAASATMAGVLTHRVGTDGYFLLTVQPKASYRTGDVASREVVLVLDTSGSMRGEPLAQAKAMASGILQTLTERDTFNVLQFASGVSAMAPAPVQGGAAGRAQGLTYLASLGAGGATEMDRGVAAMLAEEPGPEQVRIIYFLTDGFIGNDDLVIGAARKLAGRNRIMTIGVGAAPNRYLLDRLASAGRGFATYASPNEAMGELTQDLVARSAYPYLTDVTVDWGGLAVAGLSPTPLPDVYAGQPLVVSGRYLRPGRGRVVISARSAGRKVELPVEVTLPEQQQDEPVAQLWARRQVEALMREVDPERGISEDVRQQVTELGLAFHLVTQETSFVAVDRTRVVDASGRARLVEQPALTPEGVNLDGAVASAAERSSATTSSSSSSRGYRDNDSGSSWGSGASPGSNTLGLLGGAALLALVWRRRRR